MCFFFVYEHEKLIRIIDFRLMHSHISGIKKEALLAVIVSELLQLRNST